MLGRDRDHLRRELDGLKAKHVINDGTYRDYTVLLFLANTREQLDEIAHDLAEICRPFYRPFSF